MRGSRWEGVGPDAFAHLGPPKAHVDPLHQPAAAPFIDTNVHRGTFEVPKRRAPTGRR
jgi:hypothetical protein